MQALSWTLYEAVTFDATRITSVDWASYPILRFQNLPDTVDVHVISRPGQPYLGTGEAAQGPTAAAVGECRCRCDGRQNPGIAFHRQPRQGGHRRLSPQRAY